MLVTMFPHTATLYIITEDQVTFEQVTNITVLDGVLLDAAKATNVKSSGLENADSVTVYIPFGVSAMDGVTGNAKRYVSPKEYHAAADKSGVWTLDAAPPGDVTTFIVKGAVVEPDKDFQWINRIYDDVYRISSVDMKDFGSTEMQHWEVGGK